ncbi:MAG: cell wall-binding repeat-containing protein [Finegoldia magna]|nr:cell wall-binding repeat-containing protein [Finegoldia magna]
MYKNRYESSAALAVRLIKVAGNKNTAIIASGEVFAYALVVSPVAGGQSSPILLVSRNELPKSVKDYVKKNIKQITVVGGEKYVPQENVD